MAYQKVTRTVTKRATRTRSSSSGSRTRKVRSVRRTVRRRK